MNAELVALLKAAVVPRNAPHLTGSLDEARAILARAPALAHDNVFAAAALGETEAIRVLLSADASLATAKGGPYEWDALTHLCFSRFLRLDPARGDAFVSSARLLLDAGASANTGFHEPEDAGRLVFESAMYGAAGVARHAGLTRLLLERGADPNDEETPYHVPEGYDNAVLRLLLESDRLSADSLSTMLLRKADWHDAEGMQLLLAHGADPNRPTIWHVTAMQQAVRRDNDLSGIVLLLDHGGDPLLTHAAQHPPALVTAAHRGRGDVLSECARRGVQVEHDPYVQLLAACAMDDTASISAMVARDGTLVARAVADGGRLLAEFAGNGNARGVAQLLDLGVPVTSRYLHGDGYYGIAPYSTALHVAAWRARPLTVALLIDRGADVNARDARDCTPLMLAVRACVDSHWTARRDTQSIAALLAAGADAQAIVLPTGYADADVLLHAATR